MRNKNKYKRMCRKIHDELISTINDEVDIIEKAIKLVNNPSI